MIYTRLQSRRNYKATRHCTFVQFLTSMLRDISLLSCVTDLASGPGSYNRVGLEKPEEVVVRLVGCFQASQVAFSGCVKHRTS